MLQNVSRLLPDSERNGNVVTVYMYDSRDQKQEQHLFLFFCIRNTSDISSLILKKQIQ